MADTGLITSIDAGHSGVAFRSQGLASQLPANAVEQLVAEFMDQGIVAESGVNHTNTRESDDRKGLGGEVVYTLQTGVDNTYTLTLMESQNANVLRTIVGDDNVIINPENGHVTVRWNRRRLPRCSWVFDFLIDQGLKRTIVEIGQVITIGEIQNTNTEVILYEITIKAFGGPRIDGDMARDLYAYTDGSIRLGVATGMIPEATESAEFRYQLRAAGGTAPYAWTATGLPQGMNLSSDGVLSGTPEASGEVQVQFTVSDEDGNVARSTLTMHIRPASGTPGDGEEGGSENP